MDFRHLLRSRIRASIGAWRSREALARSARFRVVERRDLRSALVTSAILVAALLVGGALASTAIDPLVGWELLALNTAAAVLTLGLAWFVRGRGRRHVLGIAYLWGILMAADLLAAGLTSPLQLRTSAIMMPAMPLIYALFMPWNTRAHLIAVAWTTVAALCLTVILQRSSVDPISPIVLTALVTGAISVVGHAHQRTGRVEAFRQVVQIRALHRQARDAGRRLRATNRELATSARVDALTGVANRLALEEDLAALDAVAPGTSSASAAFVLLDLDRFKAYNDRHGHLAGDWVLRRATEALVGAVRAGDRVYRYGGEELVVVLACVDEAAAEAVVDRIRRAIVALDIPHPENRPWQVVTASAGWVRHEPGGPVSATVALAAADEALYRAKRLGRNRAVGADRLESRAVPA